MLDDHDGLAAIEAATARVAVAKASGEWGQPLPAPPPVEDRRAVLAERRQRPTLAGIAGAVTVGGPTMIERCRARDDARRVLIEGQDSEAAQARLVFDATTTEEAWAAWKRSSSY